MIQQVLLTIRYIYKKKTPCVISNFSKKSRSCVALELTTIGQREVAIISSKEMVITGRDAYQLKSTIISLNTRVRKF